MDLSNQEESRYWYDRAKEEKDPELRKLALKAHKRYHGLAVREKKLSLQMLKPSYGIRSLIGFFVVVALLILAVFLILSHLFSIGMVITVFAIVLAIIILASGLTLRVTGHVSEDTMVRMIQIAVQPFFQKQSAPAEAGTVISVSAEEADGSKQIGSGSNPTKG